MIFITEIHTVCIDYRATQYMTMRVMIVTYMYIIYYYILYYILLYYIILVYYNDESDNRNIQVHTCVRTELGEKLYWFIFSK